MTREQILDTEYSEAFDEKRKNSICVSYYKYGPSKENFRTGLVDAIGSLKKCLRKFEETGNTEYLIDVANYAMFRYMWPQGSEGYQATDSNQSAGIDGISIKEIKNEKDSYN
jgi:hypothetical protein